MHTSPHIPDVTPHTKFRASPLTIGAALLAAVVSVLRQKGVAYHIMRWSACRRLVLGDVSHHPQMKIIMFSICCQWMNETSAALCMLQLTDAPARHT